MFRSVFSIRASLRRLIRLKRDKLQAELGRVAASQIVSLGNTSRTRLSVKTICERFAQRIDATARPLLRVQYGDLMSGFDQLVSRDQSRQTSAHDDDPPRLLRP